MSIQLPIPSSELRPPALKYAFTLHGGVRSQHIGTNPVGKLVDIDYVHLEAFSHRDKDGNVLPPAGLEAMSAWKGIQGEVVAGSDWATFRSDGVIEFNGRLTLRTTEKLPREQDASQADEKGKDEDEEEDDDSILINVVVSGVVDVLSNYGDPSDNRRKRLQIWDDDPRKPPLLLALGVRFELAEAAEPWLSKELPQDNFEKYAQLRQSPFLACGSAKFNSGERLPSSVHVDILQVIPAPLASGTKARSGGGRAA